MSRANFIREFSNLTLSVIMDFFHALQREHEPGVVVEEILRIFARVPRGNWLKFEFKIKSDVPFVLAKYETFRHSRHAYSPARQAEDIFTPTQWFVVQRELRDIFSIPRTNNNRAMTFKIPMAWLRAQSLDPDVFLAKYKLILEGLANAFMFRDEHDQLKMYGMSIVRLNNRVITKYDILNVYPNGNVLALNFENDDEWEDEWEEDVAPPRGASRITTPQRPATAAESGVECTVCQEKFAAGEMIQPLSCGHLFHSNCIRPWYETSATCPLCRQLSTGGRRVKRRTSLRQKSRSRSTRRRRVSTK